MSPGENCPICPRAAAVRRARSLPPLAGPCEHVAFTTDATGYTGAGFALQHCYVYIERGTRRGKTFLEVEREIISILRQHVEIINGTGYAESRDAALTAASAAVRTYLRGLGYVVPD